MEPRFLYRAAGAIIFAKALAVFAYLNLPMRTESADTGSSALSYRLDPDPELFFKEPAAVKKNKEARPANIKAKVKGLFVGENSRVAVIELNGKAEVVAEGDRVFGSKIVKIEESGVFLESGEMLEFLGNNKLPSEIFAEPDVKKEQPRERRTIVLEKRKSGEIMKTTRIVPSGDGLLVSAVKDGLGLRKGDVIVKVNGKRVRNIADALKAYGMSKEKLVVAVVRDGKEKEISYEIR